MIHKLSTAEVALRYHNAGWHPIPVVGKEPAWKKTTGADGWNLSRKRLATIPRQNRQGDNIGLGLRMDNETIGIDVDAYKDNGKGFANALADIGELPPTFRTTARWGNNPSGVRYYRIPSDLNLDKVGRKLEKYNIDIIRRNHRHANVSPTIHPKLELQYRWYSPQDEELSSTEYCFEVPDVTELPELPMSWCIYLDPSYDPYSYVDDSPEPASHKYILSPYVLSSHKPSPVVVSSVPSPAPTAAQPTQPRIYSIPLCPPCSSDYYTHNIYRTIHDESHTTTSRNTSLYQLVRDGYWCVLRGELTEQNLDDVLFTNFTCNGYIKEHGIDDFNRVVAHQKKYAAGKFVNLPRSYNDARMQALADRVSTMKFSAKSREALYTAILDAKSKNKSYAILPTRGLGLAVGVGRNAISNYVHDWEQQGLGILKKGRTTEFRFYLDDQVLEMPTEPKVNLDSYQPQVNIFNKYIQDAVDEAYRKNGQVPPSEQNAIVEPAQDAVAPSEPLIAPTPTPEPVESITVIPNNPVGRLLTDEQRDDLNRRFEAARIERNKSKPRRE